MHSNRLRGAAAVLALLALQACDGAPETGPGLEGLGLASEKKLDADDVCSPDGEFTLVSDHPYFPLTPVLRQWVYQGEDEGQVLDLVVTVLDETEVVAGVTTRVVEEHESLDGHVVEISRNFFAQAEDGSICYFGEDVDIFDPETGEFISNEGAWRADNPDSGPGLFFPASLQPGTTFQQENAPNAADEAKIVGPAGPVEVEAGEFPVTLRVLERNPLDGGKDYKVYALGVGLILDGEAELVSFTE
jgi:hypothetical protein